MSLSLAIVGLPNVGKSTLFNALTKNNVLAANYPFATIEPNVGVVNVPDTRVDELSKISGSIKTVPAACSFVDIAGLVRGASTGEGLGNKFLSNIRECSAVVQVVRVFEDTDVVHVENKLDALADIETINTELCLADLATVTKRIETLQKELKSNPKVGTQIQELEAAKLLLDSGKILSVEMADITNGLKDLQLITAKPFLYVFNLDEHHLADEAKKQELQQLAPNIPVVFLCAKVEAELQDMPDADAQELLAGLGQSESGLASLIRLGYKTLGLQSYYTSGPTETRAWTIKVGSTAPQAAGVIHTDFEKGFIKAEVTSFDDFVAGNGWSGAKDTGKVRLEGRDYIMQDGDIVLFRFNN